MSKQGKIQEIQGRLDRLTKKWWLYLVLLLMFFLPSYAAKSYNPRESIDLIEQVLSAPLIFAFPGLMPIAKVIPVVLIAGLLVYGNKVRRPFNVYVAVLYLALAFFQTAAVTDSYGLVVITGNLALILIVALVWIWEIIAERNDFEIRKHPLWKWWVAPLAILALLCPVNAGDMSPDFHPLRLLTNEAGLTYCMVTPVVLALMALFHPTVNLPVLRISSFTGILFGMVNMITWFVIEPLGWWMGVLHIPLVVISVYTFLLVHIGTERMAPGLAPVIPHR